MSQLSLISWGLFGVFVACGTMSLLAAIFNWNWFFETSSAKMIAGPGKARQRARMIYGALGVAIIVAAFVALIPKE